MDDMENIFWVNFINCTKFFDPFYIGAQVALPMNSSVWLPMCESFV